jgi:hypothetical protein
MSHPGGRPTALTPEVTARLVAAIAGGSFLAPACRYAGVGYSTFRAWMVRGERQLSGKYRELREAVLSAEARVELKAVARWQEAIGQDWRAAMLFLERRYPKRWARRDTTKHQHTGPGGDPLRVTVTVDEILAAARAAEAEAARAAGAGPPVPGGNGCAQGAADETHW